MTPEQAAHDLAPAVVRVPGAFMMDGATFTRGGELGFDGLDFYIAGRGGALGDVPADVVAAALVFFSRDVVAPAWDRSAQVMPRRTAAEEWAKCAHAWAESNLPDGVDYGRLAGLLGRVVRDASVASAPIFAGWRSLPEPTSDRALALHRLNAIRELRGALHGAAILTVGLSPLEAVIVRSPAMVGVFGWPEPYPEPEPLHDRWGLAEARTDRMVGRNLAVLDAAEREELVALTTALA